MSHGRLATATGIIVALAALFVMFAETVRAAAPGKPTNLEATLSGRVVMLTWDAPTSGGVRGYNIEQRVNGGSWTAFTLDSPATNWTSQALTRGQTYRFKVLAYNADGEGSGYSNRVNVTVPEQEPSPTPTPAPTPDPTGVDASFDNVRVVETTADYLRLDWDKPPTRIAGVRVTRYRHDDPADHIYHALDQFGTRVTGFRDRNVEPGQTYTYRVIPWVVNDEHAHIFSRNDSTLGQSVPVTATTPPGPPFVARAPTGFNVRANRVFNASATWNDTGRETPAYIFQWRKATEAYGDGTENHPRTIINSRQDNIRERQEREGFTVTILGAAKVSAYVKGMAEDTRYYFRVGTCQERLEADGVEACNLADVRFASERSLYFSRPQ